MYQATDTDLKRKVALKVLPDAFVSDPERVTRFQREAQVLASLNHPGIAGIHGIERIGDTQALVLELVEGPTLADRIAQGPIPVDEALPMAKQIAEALEAAHEAGVIHRDLKPANIKLRPDGTVKVLDFGLAKALDTTPEGDPNQSPTLTAAATQMGVIMGTAAYMSPEQATGKVVDKRADVWAFGAVLYEMLTGCRTFTGDDVSDTLAAVLRAEVDLDAFPDDTPATVRRVIHACLQRNLKQRVADMQDVRLALEGTFETTDAAAGLGDVPVAPPAVTERRLLRGLAGVVGVLLAGATAWMLKPAPAPTPAAVMRFTIPLPAGQTLGVDYSAIAQTVAISPSGDRLVYSANGQLHLRRLDALESQPISGTEGAAEAVFSPNGAWLAYVAADDDFAIKRIAAAGGTAGIIVARDGAWSGGAAWALSWNIDDEILFATRDGIHRVSAEGGSPELVVQASDGELLSSPTRLPDGDTFLLVSRSTAASDWDEGRILAYRAGERIPIWQGGGHVCYVATGHLLYAQGRTLWALPIDADTLRVSGVPVAVVEGIMRAPRGLSDTAHYALSDNGTLAYGVGEVAVCRGRSCGSTATALRRGCQPSPDSTSISTSPTTVPASPSTRRTRGGISGSGHSPPRPSRG